MKKSILKKLVLTLSVILLLLIAVGATLSFLFANTEPVENTFTPSKVSCAVVENSGTPVSNGIQNTGDKKSNVQIKNTGDTDAYIRVAVVANWVSADGSRVWAQKPIENTDYTMTLASIADWIRGADGFYYYGEDVSPNHLTELLITEARLMEGVTAPKGTDGTQYYLSIEIVASAIQSKPDYVVANEWSNTMVTVKSSNGTLTITNNGG